MMYTPMDTGEYTDYLLVGLLMVFFFPFNLLLWANLGASIIA